MAKKKQTISGKDLKHIAKLSRISLTTSEVESYAKDLSVVIDSVENLDEVKTSGVDVVSQITGLKNIFREDKPGESISQEDALLNANKQMNGYFVIKRVIKKK